MTNPVNPRQFTLEVIGGMPESATVEDLRDQFHIILGVLESYRDEGQGQLVPHEQVKAEFQEWISKSTGRSVPAAP